jgi:hypothetical protein
MIEITSSIFIDHSGMKLEMNNKTGFRNFTNTWKLNNILVDNQWAKEEIKRKIFKYLELHMHVWQYHTKPYFYIYVLFLLKKIKSIIISWNKWILKHNAPKFIVGMIAVKAVLRGKFMERNAWI